MGSTSDSYLLALWIILEPVPVDFVMVWLDHQLPTNLFRSWAAEVCTRKQPMARVEKASSRRHKKAKAFGLLSVVVRAVRRKGGCSSIAHFFISKSRHALLA